jgi:hypothetical protein
MAIEVEDCTLTWQVTVQVVVVAQCLVSTWPSHGLPCGSGKIPNEGLRTEFQKNKIVGPPNLAEPRQIWRPIDISKLPPSWWNHQYIYYI